MKPKPPSPPPMEDLISRLLRACVIASLILIAGGTLLTYLRSGDYAPYTPAHLQQLLAPGPTFPRTAAWLGHGLARLDGAAVVVAGLLLLIFTPVMRVVVSIVAFARSRDRAYVLITSVVLVLLLVSFILGKAG